MAPSVRHMAATATLAALTVPIQFVSANVTYTLEDTYDHTNFFNKFKFISQELTHGYVTYVPEPTDGIAYITDKKTVRLGVDSSTSLTWPTSPGRKSFRIEGTKNYNGGLFIASFAHLPAPACGAWPAYWMYGPDWPNHGEYNIFETHNLSPSSQITAHTSTTSECKLESSGFTGSVLTNDCNNAAPGHPYEGCGITEDKDSPFGQKDGGVYATLWADNTIKTWSWTTANVPADVKAGKPNPELWGLPRASVGGSSCDLKKYVDNMHMVFDITFCGDLAGNTFGECSAKSSDPAKYTPNPVGCAKWIGDNPAAFADTYFEVDSIKIYQAGAASGQSQVARSNASMPILPSHAVSDSAFVGADHSRLDQGGSFSDAAHTAGSAGSVPALTTPKADSDAASRHGSPHAGLAASDYFTSTIFSTAVETILSCAPSVTNCPIGQVKTIVHTVSTTFCPVWEMESPSPSHEVPVGSGPGLVPITSPTPKPSYVPDAAPSPSSKPSYIPDAAPSPSSKPSHSPDAPSSPGSKSNPSPGSKSNPSPASAPLPIVKSSNTTATNRTSSKGGKNSTSNSTNAVTAGSVKVGASSLLLAAVGFGVFMM